MKSFKDIRESVECKKSLLEEKPELKIILENHINLKEGLSDNALVSLIVYINGNDINESSIRELKLFKYLTDENKVTELGNEYAISEECIKRLKDMVA